MFQPSSPRLRRTLNKVKAKTESLSGLVVKEDEAAEPLQMVNYGIGGHYEPHVDYFGENMDVVRGDRVATMLFYLTSEVQGGATVFPFLNLAISPTKGSALFWYNTRRNGQGGDALTMHAG